jgi:hypothetical protein
MINLKNRLRADGATSFRAEYMLDSDIEHGSDDPIHGVRGKIDILAFYNDGRVQVIEIKTSGDSYNDWDLNRKDSANKQLGYYRRILESKGIGIDDLRISLLPITL